MSLCVLTIASLLLCSPQEGKITFSCLGASVENTLVELSKATSLKLESVKELKGMPLIIAVKDMGRQEILDAVAEALSARWTQSGDTLLLAPDMARRRLLAQTARVNIELALKDQLSVSSERQSYTQAMNASFRAMEALKKATSSEEQAQYLGALYFMPSSAMTSFAASCVTAKELADLSPGERSVYASRPTQMQKPMTPRMQKSLQDYANSVNDYKERVGRIGFSPNLLLDKSVRQYIEGLMNQQKPPADPYIDIIAYESPWQYGISFRERSSQNSRQVMIYINRVTQAVLLQRDSKLSSLRNRVASQTVSPSPGAKKISAIIAPADRDTRSLVIDGRYYGMERNLTALNALSAEEFDDVMHPERVDPLTWYVGPAIGQLAEASGINFILSPSDACLVRIASFLGRANLRGDVFLNQLCAEPLSAFPDLISATPEMLILRQDFSGIPSGARATDRNALKLALESLATAPFIGPKQAKSLGFLIRDLPRSNSAWFTLASKPTITYGYAAQAAYDFFKLFDKEVFSSNRSGTSLRVSQLTAEQRDQLSRLVYGGSTTHVRAGSSGWFDVTEALPNGLPNDAELLIQLSAQYSVLAWKADPNVALSRSIPLAQADRSTMSDFSGYLPLEVNTWRVSLTYKGIVWGPTTYNADLDYAGRPVTDWQKLPPNFVDAIRSRG